MAQDPGELQEILSHGKKKSMIDSKLENLTFHSMLIATMS